MKRVLPLLLAFALILTGCRNTGHTGPGANNSNNNTSAEDAEAAAPVEGAVNITLADDGVTVDGEAISGDSGDAVYAANDIVFYQEGQDFTYGEGTEADAHPQSEADGHTVVHITQPGIYAVSGKLSAGQIAVDLGEDAEGDPGAVVTLVLNGVDITCSVAPAVIFYNVYECGSKDTETAAGTVDTSAAGANVIIADGTENHVTGSYVARIYKPGSVELNDAGTEVADAKKLHKYDAAFYSKMSMNIDGGEAGTGVLNIDAENEGLGSELHLTINGGSIRIESGNDGINTNEDGVSVTTINDGNVDITVTGETGEGDGIDSNGWLVINGGTVAAHACSTSGDAGIDSDMGIYLNGGTVSACGNMLDRIAGGDAAYAVFQFAERQAGGTAYTLKSSGGDETGIHSKNDFTYLLLSSDELVPGEYTLWQGDTQLAGSGDAAMGQMGNMTPPGGFDQQPALPEGVAMPEGATLRPGENMDPNQMPRPDGAQPTPPEDMTLPEGQMTPPEGMTMPEGQMPPVQGDGDRRGDRVGNGVGGMAEVSATFTIVEGGNYFTNVAPVE